MTFSTIYSCFDLIIRYVVEIRRFYRVTRRVAVCSDSVYTYIYCQEIEATFALAKPEKIVCVLINRQTYIKPGYRQVF